MLFTKLTLQKTLEAGRAVGPSTFVRTEQVNAEFIGRSPFDAVEIKLEAAFDHLGLADLEPATCSREPVLQGGAESK